MKLREFLDEWGIAVVRFAKRAKVSPATIHNAINGKQISLKVAMRIEKATEGKVTCKDLSVE